MPEEFLSRQYFRPFPAFLTVPRPRDAGHGSWGATQEKAGLAPYFPGLEVVIGVIGKGNREIGCLSLIVPLVTSW